MSDNVKNIIWVLLASILIAAFLLMGGCSNSIETPSTQDVTSPASTSTAVDIEAQETFDDIGVVEGSKQTTDSKNNQEKPEVIIEKNPTCEIAITCEILARDPELLPPGKRELIPTDGIILATKTMSFKQGESVFDILVRATKDNGIHMEFVKTPIYNSAYIEGIHNIYEFDGGEGSGWMYNINGAFPQGGASTYIIKPNDQIHWVYSCDLGKDVGGYTVNQKDE